MNPNTIPPSPKLSTPGARADAVVAVALDEKPRSVVHRRPRRPLSGALGLLIVAFWLLMALVGPWLAPYGANALVADDVFGPLSLQFPLGTDFLGGTS
jgi:peptide/nickel transport system permease protein